MNLMPEPFNLAQHAKACAEKIMSDNGLELRPMLLSYNGEGVGIAPVPRDVELGLAVTIVAARHRPTWLVHVGAARVKTGYVNGDPRPLDDPAADDCAVLISARYTDDRIIVESYVAKYDLTSDGRVTNLQEWVAAPTIGGTVPAILAAALLTVKRT